MSDLRLVYIQFCIQFYTPFQYVFVGFPHHHQAICWPSWVSYKSTQFSQCLHYLTGWGLSPTSLPLHMSIINPGCRLGFWPMGYRLEIPMTPFLGSINLLEWLTELRETFYLLCPQFIIKGHSWGTARWERCEGRGVGKGQEFPCPGYMPFLRALLSPSLPVFPCPEAL